MSRVLRLLSVLPALVFLSACTARLAGAAVAGDYTCTNSIFDTLDGGTLATCTRH